MITLCTPTRGRPERFAKMLKSARDTATDFEVCAWLDEDDESNYPIDPQVKYGRGSRPLKKDDVHMAGLWTKAWEMGSGDVAMMCADDVVFMTEGWDERVQDEIAKFSDRLVMVYTLNGADDRPLLPFVSREWIDAAGFVPGDLQGWFADEWIWSLAAEIGRIVLLDDVMIRHEQFGYDQTYEDAIKTRERMGGLIAMRRQFYSIPNVKRRDELVSKLEAAKKSPVRVSVPGPPDWERESLEDARRAREHEAWMRDDTLVVTHCYAGDKAMTKNMLKLSARHGAQMLVLSPEDSPVKIKGVECRSAGKAGYFGQVSLDRQRKHLEILLEYPQTFFLLNDADSICISPAIPRYLYEQGWATLWSNEVMEWRPHRSPYPKIACQPPYFLRRETIAAMLAVAELPQVKAHPITPYIDWYMLALACEARLMHRSYFDGASFPAWGREDLAETQMLGNNPKHVHDPKAPIQGARDMAWQVHHGAVMLHSIKHLPVLRALVREHEDYVSRGAPERGTMTVEDYVRQREADFTLREDVGGMREGETIRI